MNVLILGATGKFGKYLSKEIVSKKILLKTQNLYLQGNLNVEDLEYLSAEELNIKVFKSDFYLLDDLKRLISEMPQKIDVFINLLSVFEESKYSSEIESVDRVLRINFHNQVLFLKETLPRVGGGVVVQFLDECVRKPYVSKYFWYSVSRSALYSFYQNYKEYATRNFVKQRVVLLFPEYIKESDYQSLSKTIDKYCASEVSDFEIIEIPKEGLTR